MAASYPSSAKSFTPLVDGTDYPQADQVNQAYDEIAALEAALITSGLAHDLKFVDATHDIGNSGAFRPRHLFLSGNATIGGTLNATVVAEQTTSATGAQNNFDLDGRVTLLRCSGAAPVFSGFTVNGSAPSPGDQVLISYIGSGTVRASHQDTNSTDVNRVIGQSVRGQIVGVNGQMLLTYDGTTDRWRIGAVDPGTPISVAHAGGNFTASGSMTWTVASGDQTNYWYVQRGKLVTVGVSITTSTTGGTQSTDLQVAIPNSFIATKRVHAGASAVTSAGGTEAGHLFVGITSAVITGRLGDAGNWPLESDTVGLEGVIEFEAN